MKTGHERGLNDEELAALLARLRNINRLAIKGTISDTQRRAMQEDLVPEIWHRRSRRRAADRKRNTPTIAGS
ncbi:MAG: hypothetical protein ACREHG_06250 [Candidatus Saccharimonadales bacterium]